MHRLRVLTIDTVVRGSLIRVICVIRGWEEENGTADGAEDADGMAVAQTARAEWDERERDPRPAT